MASAAANLQTLLDSRRHTGGIDHHVGHARVTWYEPQHVPGALCVQNAHNLCSARRLVEDGNDLCGWPHARKMHHAAAARASQSTVHTAGLSSCTAQLELSGALQLVTW